MKFKETPNGHGAVCAHCPMSYAYIESGRLVILSRHEHRTHTNSLTAADLRKLADILDESEKASCAMLKPEQAAEAPYN